MKFFHDISKEGPGVGEDKLRYPLCIGFSNIEDEYRATRCIGFVGHPKAVFISANR